MSSELVQWPEDGQASPGSWETVSSADSDSSDQEYEFNDIEDQHRDLLPPEIASSCENWRRIYKEISARYFNGRSESSFRLDANCCELCRFLHHGSYTFINESKEDDATVYWVYPHSLEVRIGDFPYRRVNFFRVRDVPCPWGLLPQRLGFHPSLANTSRSDVLEKATKLVSYCLTKHSCGNLADESFMPTRLIQIVRLNPNQVRLTLTKGLRARYMCLSHCWGSKQPLRTTKENLKDHLDHLAWDIIPICYQEAIRLAAHLGIHYLWIDSLCIIQDDDDDWVAESQQMCHVYENSFFTVCATSSPDCETGMWNLSDNRRGIFHGITAAGNRYSYIAIEELSYAESHPSYLSSTENLTTVWPLLQRAWVFQERMLSPRVLHFSRGELIWECQEETFCECGGMWTYGKDKKFHDIIRSSGSSQLATAWREIVQFYSRLSSTKETDKLPALSGLAQRFARQQPNAKYLAGLWDESLVEDLMWLNPNAKFYGGRGHYARVNQPSSPQRAPSWSWATTNNPIVFSTGSHFTLSNTGEQSAWIVENYVKIIKAECELATSDPTGQVKGGGMLEIAGRLFSGIIRISESFNLTLRIEESGSSFDFTMSSNMYRLSLHLDEPHRYYSGGEPVIPGDGRVICLPLVRLRRDFTRETDDAPWGEEEEFALVLVPINRGGKKYKRVGAAVLTTKREDLQNCRNIGKRIQIVSSLEVGRIRS
ncbi:hypothetical protein EG329_000554 [Mollisiaceae sp. DMI_Dod_QoI]|nr:hypothetical protein EG329_000554 [Helotiales sp. DMI_Dod_QoI]